MISIIVGTTSSGIIAMDGKIPWRCPADMKHFKKTTIGNIVVMGRKTWDSIGNKCLPKRDNIIITRNADGVKLCSDSLEKGIGIPWIADSIGKAQRLARKMHLFEHPEVFIIGGEEIYRQCLREKIVDRIYLSLIDDNLIDSSIPENNIKKFEFGEYAEWKESKTEEHEGFKLLIYEKIN